MFNNPELYTLSFVSFNKKSRTNPQIVFTIRAEHSEEVAKRLAILVSQETKASEEYFDGAPPFYTCDPDLFGNIFFGYGSVGWGVKEGGLLNLHVELLPGALLHRSTKTIQLLAMALGYSIESNGSNKAQQVEIHTCAEYPQAGSGHRISGHISRDMIAWLRKQGTANRDGGVSVPEEVIKAMNQTWAAVSNHEGNKKLATDCRGLIRPDGSFILICPGNACDMGVYYDGIWEHEEENDTIGRLSCHNLDSPQQQVTLLAGLITLAEIARGSE